MFSPRAFRLPPSVYFLQHSHFHFFEMDLISIQFGRCHIVVAIAHSAERRNITIFTFWYKIVKFRKRHEMCCCTIKFGYRKWPSRVTPHRYYIVFLLLGVFYGPDNSSTWIIINMILP